MQKIKGQTDRATRMESLDHRVLLAVTATTEEVGSLNDSLYLAPGRFDAVIGPAGQILETKVISRDSRGERLELKLGSQSFAPSQTSYDYVVRPRFAGFDSSGRALISIEHTVRGDNGIELEYRAVEFPANGSAARYVTGLPLLQQAAYDNAVALSPNGGVLGAEFDYSSNSIKFTRVVGGLASTITVNGLHSPYNLRIAAMNNAGDFFAVVGELATQEYRLISVRGNTVRSVSIAPLVADSETDIFSAAIGNNYGALGFKGQMWRFDLRTALSLGTPLVAFEYPATDIVSSGNDQFIFTGMDSGSLTSIDTGRGRIRSGYYRDGRNSISTNLSGQFVATHTRSEFLPGYESEGHIEYGIKITGQIDDKSQIAGRVQPDWAFTYGEGATIQVIVTNHGSAASAPEDIKLSISPTASGVGETYLSQFGTNQLTLPAIAAGQTTTLTFQTALPPYPFLQRYGFPSSGQIVVWARGQGTQGFSANVSVSVSSPAVLRSRVDGIVWRGVAGTAATGVRVYLDANYNNRYDTGELSSITNSVGYYRIDYTSTATQHLMVDVAGATPAGGFWYGTQYLGEQRRFIFTAPAALNRVSGKVSNSAGVALSGIRVFRDANNNNRYDAGELASVTNATGNYVLEFAGTGSQHITIDDSNFTPSAGYTFTITTAGTQKVYNFTLTPPAVSKVAGTIFKDTNRNGRLDAGETKLAGRTVFADYNFNGRLDAGEASAITDATGAYLLTTRATNVSLRLLLKPGETISLPSGATSIWLSSVSGTVTGKNIGVVVG